MSANDVVLQPVRTLRNWGGDLTGYFPEPHFFGMDTYVALVFMARCRSATPCGSALREPDRAAAPRPARRARVHGRLRASGSASASSAATSTSSCWRSSRRRADARRRRAWPRSRAAAGPAPAARSCCCSAPPGRPRARGRPHVRPAAQVDARAARRSTARLPPGASSGWTSTPSSRTGPRSCSTASRCARSARCWTRPTRTCRISRRADYILTKATRRARRRDGHAGPSTGGLHALASAPGCAGAGELLAEDGADHRARHRIAR